MNLKTPLQKIFQSPEIRNRWALRSLQLAIGPLAAVGVFALADTNSGRLLHPWIGPLVWRIFWTIYTAFFFLATSSGFHETAHQFLSRGSSLDALLGRLMGTAMGVSFTAYLETHIRHHAKLNQETDWELWPYAQPSSSLLFRRIFVWIDLLLGCLTAPMIYSRIFFHSGSPLLFSSAWRKIAIEYLVILLFWGFILAHVREVGNWEKFFRIWVIPFWIAGILQSARKLTEHLGMEGLDGMSGTRTVVPGGVWSRISFFLNFEIFLHGPHHTRPLAGYSFWLKMARARQMEESSEVFPSYWAAIQNMVPHLFNPASGLKSTTITTEAATIDRGPISG